MLWSLLESNEDIPRLMRIYNYSNSLQRFEVNWGLCKIPLAVFSKVRETEEARDRQRKENLELKRGLNDEVHEKQTLSKANEQLREQVKKAEQERIALKVVSYQIFFKSFENISKPVGGDKAFNQLTIINFFPNILNR